MVAKLLITEVSNDGQLIKVKPKRLRLLNDIEGFLAAELTAAEQHLSHSQALGDKEEEHYYLGFRRAILNVQSELKKRMERKERRKK